jgi:5-methylthioribose kinase
VSPSPYPILQAAAAGRYVTSRPHLAAIVGEVVDVVECGEGKINGVFIVRGAAGSLVLKQGLPWVRILPDWALTSERVGREAAVLETWGDFGEGLVPRSFGYDEDLRVLAMEHLADHRLWREDLQLGNVEPAAATAMGRLIGRVAFHTSPFALGVREHAARMAEAQNAEMTQLMEDVVFTIPFADDPRNTREPALLRLGDRLRRERALLAAVAELKFEYRTRQEAFIHGDLHTGSVMVRAGAPCAIDAEFGRYGPVAWDLGELCAHFRMSAAALAAIGDDAAATAAASLSATCWAAFAEEIDGLWRGHPEVPFADGFLDRWLAGTKQLAGRFSGVEVLRRVIGVGDAEELRDLSAPMRGDVAAALLDEARDAACGATPWI